MISNAIVDGSFFAPKGEKLNVEENVGALKNYIKDLEKGVPKQEAYNKNIENAHKSLKAYLNDVGDDLPVLEDFKNQQKAMNAQMRFTGPAGKIAGIGLSALSAAASSLVSMGIGLVLNLIVQGISNLMNAEQEAIDKANELTQAYKDNTQAIEDNVKSLSGAQSEFEQLAMGVDEQGSNLSLTTEQYERYQEIVKEIAETCPELVKGYTAEGQAIIDKNGAIEQAIALLEKQKELEKDQYIYDPDFASGKIAEIEQAKNQLSEPTISMMNSLRKDNQQLLPREYDSFMEGFGINYSKLISGNTEEVRKLLSMKDEFIEGLRTQYNMSEQELILTRQQLSQMELKVGKVEQLNAELSNYYKLWAADDSNAPWMQQIDPEYLDEFYAAIDQISADSSITDKTTAIKDMADGFGELTERMPLSEFEQLIELYRTGVYDDNVFAILSRSMTTTLEQMKEQFPEMSAFIDELIEELQNVEQAAPAEPLSAFAQTLSNVKTEYQALDSVIEKAKNQQALSGDEIDALLAKYPELSDSLIQVGNGYGFEVSALESLQEAAINAANAQIQAELDSAEQALKNSGVRINAIGDEISAINQLITAKINEKIADFKSKNNIYTDPSSGRSYIEQAEGYDELMAQISGMREQERVIIAARNQLDQILARRSSGGGSSGGSSGISNTTAAIKEQNTALKNHLALLEHQKAMGVYDGNQAKYIDDLTYAYNNLAKTQDERWSLEEKIYSARKSWEEEQKRAAEERRKAEEEEAERKKKELEDYLSSLEKAKSAVEELVDLRIKLIEKEKEAEKEALEAAKEAEEKKLDAINETIDARRKALRQLKDEKDSEEELAERQKAIQRLQRELTALSADDSAAATARRLELEEELAEKQKELADYQYEQNIAKQEEALDREAELAQQEYDQKAAKYDEQIAAIEEFLSKQGLLFQTALNDINNMNDEMYQQMIAYNKEYGDSLDSSVKKIWEEASAAMAAYKGELESVGDAYERISGLIAENNRNEYSPAPGSSATSQGSQSSGGSPAAQPPAAPPSNTVGGYPRTGTLSVARGSWVIRAGTNTGTAAVGYVFGGESHSYSDVYIDPADGSVWRLISKNGRTGWIGPKAVASYALGGVDATGGYKLLHGAPGAVETIFNAAQGKRLYDLVASPSELSRSVAANLAASLAGFSREISPAQAPLVINQGDVVINGNAEDEAIRRLQQLQRDTIDKTVRQINQTRYKRGYSLNAKTLL